MKLSKREKVLVEKLKSTGKIPTHIAIIMDGNGRWAVSQGLQRVAGHRRGVETVRNIVEISVELGIKYLTLYTFSTENWKRPKKEVSTLMRLIVKSLQNETDELNRNGVKLTTIGNLNTLPDVVQSELNQAKKLTENNKRLVLNLALSYSGRTEIIEAVKNISQKYKNNELDLNDINETLFSEHLQTGSMPDPDLLIRSGGELRISNYLLWQIAYSEIYVTDVLWPDFKISNLLQAVEDFQKRERRFGLISEQVKNSEEIQDADEKLTNEMAEL